MVRQLAGAVDSRQQLWGITTVASLSWLWPLSFIVRDVTAAPRDTTPFEAQGDVSGSRKWYYPSGNRKGSDKPKNGCSRHLYLAIFLPPGKDDVKVPVSILCRPEGRPLNAIQRCCILAGFSNRLNAVTYCSAETSGEKNHQPM